MHGVLLMTWEKSSMSLSLNLILMTPRATVFTYTFLLTYAESKKNSTWHSARSNSTHPSPYLPPPPHVPYAQDLHANLQHFHVPSGKRYQGPASPLQWSPLSKAGTWWGWTRWDWNTAQHEHLDFSGALEMRLHGSWHPHVSAQLRSRVRIRCVAVMIMHVG